MLKYLKTLTITYLKPLIVLLHFLKNESVIFILHQAAMVLFILNFVVELTNLLELDIATVATYTVIVAMSIIYISLIRNFYKNLYDVETYLDFFYIIIALVTITITIIFNLASINIAYLSMSYMLVTILVIFGYSTFFLEEHL